jgi:hypothetical protein
VAVSWTASSKKMTALRHLTQKSRKAQAEVAGKNVIRRNKTCYLNHRGQGEGGFQAKDDELNKLSPTSKGASKGTLVDKQIRFVEEKTIYS